MDFSKPKGDGVFDGDEFLKYFRESFKVENKKGNLGDAIEIKLEGPWQTFLFIGLLCSLTTFLGTKLLLLPNAKLHVSKRYAKYLTKKYLKKIQLKDFIRYAATIASH